MAAWRGKVPWLCDQSLKLAASTDLESAKRAALLLLQQIEIKRQMMVLLNRNDW